MIVVDQYKDKQVGVYGLGRTGVSVIASLVAGGATVLAWDDGEAARDAAGDAGAVLMPASGWNWMGLEVLILSPGIPLHFPEPHPIVEMARQADVPILGDTELFARALALSDADVKVVGITGTNGKSTTTALLSHLLKRCGFSVQTGGNIGKPVLELDAPTDGTIYVIEFSSYQIDLTESLDLDVGILLNITPDHLDRHGGMDGYIKSKRALLDWVKPEGLIAIGVDSEPAEQICTELWSLRRENLMPISVGKALSHGFYVLDGILFDGTQKLADEITDLKQIEGLPGKHNWENAAAAYVAASFLGAERARMLDGLQSFTGLAHRMEPVGRLADIRFVNDSKATNPDATDKALECFSGIYWIAGGRAKDEGLGSLAHHFPRIAKVYLIGESMDRFGAELEGQVSYVKAGTIDEAVTRAAKDAEEAVSPEPVVLFSPACASFDQFSDFEARGDYFREAVSNLINGSGEIVELASSDNGGSAA